MGASLLSSFGGPRNCGIVVRIQLGTLALGILLLAPAFAGEQADAVIAEAGAALESGDAAAAKRLADGGLEEGGLTGLQRGRLLLDRGLAQELLGAHDQALIDFTAAIQTRALPAAEQAQALLQRGFLLDGMNRLNDAAKDYGAVIALRSDSLATALNNRANVYRRQDKLALARRDYQAAVAVPGARLQYPYYGLGQVAEAQGDKDGARAFYAKAAAADPAYRLAADRLAELGGPPEGSRGDPGVIVLHPPKPAQAHQEASEAAPAASPQRVVLKPPAAKAKPAAARPARGGPGLRPALDGPSGGGEPQVQLGAWRSEGEAQTGWTLARHHAADALDGAVAHIVMADLPGRGRYFRLRVSTAEPQKLCDQLKAAGLDCVRVRD